MMCALLGKADPIAGPAGKRLAKKPSRQVNDARPASLYLLTC